MSKVKLGDVASEKRETWRGDVQDSRRVGLEHLIPGDYLLKNWASEESNTTFTKKFCKGQLLLGRRRVYLKKAAAGFPTRLHKCLFYC